MEAPDGLSALEHAVGVTAQVPLAELRPDVQIDIRGVEGDAAAEALVAGAGG